MLAKYKQAFLDGLDRFNSGFDDLRSGWFWAAAMCAFLIHGLSYVQGLQWTVNGTDHWWNNFACGALMVAAIQFAKRIGR